MAEDLSIRHPVKVATPDEGVRDRVPVSVDPVVGFTPSDAPASSVLVASVQVGAELAGHLLAVVSAHDRAMRLLPPSRHLTGQVPLLVLMVGYTSGGLALLFAG